MAKRAAGARQRSSSAVVPGRLTAGVVGLGLMGAGIAGCLLAAGHPVVAVTPDPAERRSARRRILIHLGQAHEAGRTRTPPRDAIRRFQVSDDYAILAPCQLVIESVIEDLAVKQAVLASVEAQVSPRTLIGSNTSALPITSLQSGARRPQRILGIHWALPPALSRFMEIICGQHTAPAAAQRALALARRWGKQPTLVRKDVRGFIVNRIGYALLREAFHLVESGVASPADIDRALRHTLGTWVPFAGPFRAMDLTGLAPYVAVMRDLLPELSCDTAVPPTLEKLVRSGARGIRNGRGFYRYTPAQARRWERAFRDFGREIIALADRYADLDSK